MDVSVKAGGRQIEYEDEDPRIRKIYAEELARTGAEMRMPPHPPPVGEVRAIDDVENVELATVGIDIGSSTSHLVFSRVLMRRDAPGLSSRFVVARARSAGARRSSSTPYQPGWLIDAGTLGRFVDECYRSAGVKPDDVRQRSRHPDREALKRRNARPSPTCSPARAASSCARRPATTSRPRWPRTGRERWRSPGTPGRPCCTWTSGGGHDQDGAESGRVR